MKKVLIALSMFVAVAFTTNSLKAQTGGIGISDPTLNIAAGNLVNVQDVDVAVILQNIKIDVTDVIDVDIANVLNNNDVRVLTDFLNNLSIDNVLNNTLRDANFLNKNQVVVGVAVNLLTGVVEQVLVADRADLKGQKGKK